MTCERQLDLEKVLSKVTNNEFFQQQKLPATDRNP